MLSVVGASDRHWEACSVSFPLHTPYYSEFICLFEFSCLLVYKTVYIENVKGEQYLEKIEY